jgi:hypothetical protein
MAKTKISEYSATAANNTDVESVNIAEGCAPSGINNAIREVMSHLKDFQVGSAGDSLTVGGNFSVTGTVTIPDNAISGDKVEGGTINAITINTLTATNNPTLSAGTANGVTYLNGSKVLTSGSGLTTNGSSLGVGSSDFGGAGSINVSVGVAGTTTGGLQLWSTTTGQHYVQFGDGTAGAATYAGAIGYSHATDQMFFYANGTEAMRLTSTSLYTASGINVGIGTSSPGSFDAFANNLVVGTGSGSEGITIYGGSTDSSNLSFADGTGAAAYQGFIQYEHLTDSLKFYVNYSGSSSSRLTIDSSGNLGLGVTPSAWVAGYKVLQVGNASWYTDGNANIYLAANTYQASGFVDTYISSNEAAKYEQINGAHKWFTAPSGTAGAAISFTQAMTLGADGLLQVGTTTGGVSDGKLQVRATGTGSGAANTVIGLNVFEETSGNKAGLWFGTMTNSNVGVIGSRTASGSIAFQTYNGGWGERARIMSDGNLQVSSNGTPDTTTTNSGINVNGYYGVLGLNHSGNDYSIVNIHTSGGNNKLFEWRWANSSVGSISTNGSSTSYNTTSDYRLKENWVAVADASTRVNALNPVNFAWKADGSRVDGFLAHELAEVVPEAVTGTKDATEMVDIKDEEGNVTGQEERPVYQGIDQSKLVPLLTAALQEALAEINSLKARLDAANL